MTAQFNDLFRYRDSEYALAGMSHGQLFHRAVFGLQPVMASTACWRGYVAVFAISDSRLVLEDLFVNLSNQDKGPTINGIKPLTKPETLRSRFGLFNNHYMDFKYHLEYTGGLLLGDRFIRELYVHMGFHPAWKYQTVMELIFEDGILTAEFDHSERMAELRQRILASQGNQDPHRLPTNDEIREFVENVFDRTYRMNDI